MQTPSQRAALAIILAAGLGTRMQSDRPKVMHRLGGVPLIGHVLDTAAQNCAWQAIVIGPDMGDLEAEIARAAPDATTHVQTDRKGTAHAALAARDAVGDGVDFVLVMFGDTPLIRPQTPGLVIDALADGADLCVLGFHAADPTGYGRLITEGNRLVAIREEIDANDEEKKIKFCNSGIIGFRREHFLPVVEAIGDDNQKGEFYLTDAVEIANGQGLAVIALAGEEAEFLGINSRKQLAEAEAVFQHRRRAEMLAGGVTLVAPETVFFAADTVIGRDVTIEPHVYFGPDVRLGDGTVVHAFCHIEGAHVGAGSQIGPFARLRPGTKTAPNVKIGNFVETKKAMIGQGAKLNHLSYLGDATIGARANIGAGTITCNYDGFDKFETHIGDGAFIGSNSALVAPVTIEDGAYVGSGSVVTETVPKDNLAIARGHQTNKDGWAARFRAGKTGRKS